MKRLALFAIAALLVASSLFAESKRMVLLEEFTNSYCGPCASQNPAFQAYVEANLDKAIPVVFHPWWPGVNDPMYQDNIPMHRGRTEYYQEKGWIGGVPSLVINGLHNASPGSPSGYSSYVNDYGSEMSPITIDASLTKGSGTFSIEVNVATDEAINGKILRVALVQEMYEHDGANGEDEFPWVARKMFPDVDGQAITIGAGEDQTFNFDNFLVNPEYANDPLYVVAWVQDETTKEVLQAGTSQEFTLTQLASEEEPFQTIGRNTSESGMFTITNPNDVEVTYSVSHSEVIDGWSVEFDNDMVTLAPGASQEVTATISTNDIAAFFPITFTVEPVNVNNTAVSSSLTMGLLTEDVKHAILSGGDELFGLAYNSLAGMSEMQGELAVLPMNANIIDAYSDVNFETLTITVGYGARGILSGAYSNSKSFLDLIERTVNNGGGVYIASILDLYNVTANGSSQGKNFFNNTLGITNNGNPKQRIQTNSNGQITGVVAFDVDGFDGTICDGMDFTANQYSQSNPYYVYFTDVINVTGDGTPIMYMDGDESQVGAVAVETGNARVVFSSFTPGSLLPADRNAFMGKVYEWLLAGASGGPSIAVTENSLDFGTVKLNESGSMMFKIQNTGDADLEIQSTYTDGADGVAFSVDKTLDGTTIAPGEEVELNVTFTPSEAKDYAATFVIESNSKSNSDLEIDLMGVGQGPDNVIDGVAYLEGFNMQVTPNPVADEAKVVYNVNGSAGQNVTIKLVDINGNVLATVANGVAAGYNEANFNASQYASGSYFLVAEVNGKAVQLPFVIAK